MSIRFLVSGVLCVFVQIAAASEMPTSVRGVIVLTPGQNLAEAHAYAVTHDKLLLSEYLETTRPGDDHVRQLKQRLEKAQRAWLSSDLETARSEFRALTEMSLKADWRDAQREVLQTAYLRLAQMAESGTERESWLEPAARLYGDVTVNTSLYPPPLLTEYQATRTRLSTQSTEIELHDVFPDFKFAIIDGRKIEIALESRLLLAPGIHRLTAYSDSHEAMTEFLTASQLRVLRLSPPVLTEGACESAKLRLPNELPTSLNVEIYSGADCPHDLSTVLRQSQFISEPRFASSQMPNAPATISNRRTWLWVIGGALIAGAGYALATRHDSTPDPVHRSGF